MFQTAFYQKSIQTILGKPSDCPPTFVHYIPDNKRYQYFMPTLLNFHLKFYFGGKNLSLVASLRGFVSSYIGANVSFNIYYCIFKNQYQIMKIIFNLKQIQKNKTPLCDMTWGKETLYRETKEGVFSIKSLLLKD